MSQYDWRGNVRELHNVVERLLILSEGDQVEVRDVDRFVQPNGSSAGSIAGLVDQYEAFSDFRDQAEKLFIQHKLDQYDWNISKTAEAIGIQRSHLYNKMSKYDIERH